MLKTKKDSPGINMAVRTLCGLIIALIISINAWADEIQINPAHPDQYTVIKGDTLWDIAGKFLAHPWLWPELWRDNAQIKNPNLIYPGDTLYFSIVNGKPQLSLSQQLQLPSDAACVLNEDDIKKGRSQFAVSKDGKLLPCIRETVIKQAIEIIPRASIAQFLNSPNVMATNDLNNAPYIVDIAGEHLIAGMGDKLYVHAISQSESLNYIVYRMGDTYVSPETGEILGYEVKYVADATLQQPGDPATLAVTQSNSEIRQGDRLMPKPEEEPTVNYFPRPPKTNISGRIISVLGGVTQIGLYNVVVIDKGAKDGIQTGHVLTIYQNDVSIKDPYTAANNIAVKLPDKYIGTLMVFRPFERVSYALVMKATQAMHILDKVKTP